MMTTQSDALTIAPTIAPTSALAARLLTHPLIRWLLGTLAVVLPVAVIMALAHQIPDKALRQAWPQLLAAGACMAAYRWYVTRIERRAPAELGLAGAGRELATGAALGAGMLLATVALVALSGAYHVDGFNPWTVVLHVLPEMVLVALFEELLFRAVLLRILEQALGSRIALALMALLFAAAHLPNAAISLIPLAATVLAGLVLGLAYMWTRRIWMAVGFHFAWNYLMDVVFSVPVSGQPAHGWLQGRLNGPDWLSGGAYGIEGSLLTLLLYAALSAVMAGVLLRRGAFRARARKLVLAAA